MISETKYDANFTAGGLFVNEFNNLREYLVNDDFEEVVRKDVDENKLLAISTLSARKRISSELIRRQQTMPKHFWVFFQDLLERESKLALFYVCLQTYPVVFDIHFQVSVRKFKLGDTVEEYDVQMRLDELASQSDEVDSWSETTIKKINVQYRKALKDAGLYDGKYLKRPNVESDQFWEYFKDKSNNWFLEACFM